MQAQAFKENMAAQLNETGNNKSKFPLSEVSMGLRASYVYNDVQENDFQELWVPY